MPETRAPAIIAGNVIPFLAGTIFFAGRVVTRASLLRTWSADDWLLSIGWVAALANCIGACLGTRFGAGEHLADLRESDLIPAFQLSYGTLILYQICICFVKLSLCVLYLRVFNTTRQSRWFLYGVALLTIIFTVANECVSIFQCNPINGVWDPLIKSKCINTIPSFYASSVCNMVVDIALIAFAIPQIMRLKVAHAQKVALLITVALGFIPLIASMIRVIRVSAVLKAADKSWVSYDSSIWSAVDCNVSILCASAPIVKPLVRKLMPVLLGSTNSEITSNTRSRPTAGDTNRYVGTTRGTWTNASKSKSGAFGTVSAIHHPNARDDDSSSEIELAQHAGQAGWALDNKPKSRDGSDDGKDIDTQERTEHNGIYRSTQVTVERS